MNELPAWVRSAQAPTMNRILQHPRLVFDQIKTEERTMFDYYLTKGEPFTVVMR